MTSVNRAAAWARAWTAFDYGYLLPFLARLPVPLGLALARLRGALYASLKRDWRQFSFADDRLWLRTQQTMQILMPSAKPEAVAHAVRQRYIMQSLEELEASWLACRDFTRWPVKYEGLDEVRAVVKAHGRVVFVTAHYGSSILGTIFLGVLGVPVLGMSSNVVDDPRVHPAIGRFYRRKYSAMGPYLRGGRVLDRQGNSRRFARFLKDGGAVVIVGDLPPDPNETPLPVKWFDQTRHLASGASRLAGMHNAPLLAFVCKRTQHGYTVTFSRPGYDPYQLFERQITADPSAWWAADLLPLLPVQPPVDH